VKFKVYTSSQKSAASRRRSSVEFKRRAAIEHVIGHLKERQRLGRITSSASAATPPTPCSPLQNCPSP
jgi:hypothetical protein